MFTKFRYLNLPLLCLFGFLLTFSAGAKEPSQVLDIQHWTTPKGARVYFVSSTQLPIVDILVTFDAGSARDDNKSGLANLTNAMLNEGTTTLDADQIAFNFEKVGALFTTNTDRDMAVVGVRSLTNPDHLQPALQTFVDVLANPSFPQTNMQRVQQQVLNALQAEQEALDEVANKAFFQTLYKNHPYGHPVLGTKEAIMRITTNDLRAFYKQYYVAKNAIILIVGAIDKNKAAEIATQIDQQLTAGTAPSAMMPAPTLVTMQQEKIDHPSEQTHIRMGQIGITRHDPDYFPLLVGNYIFGGDPLISRLAIEIREKRGLTYTIYSYFFPLSAPGPFFIDFETKPQQAQPALQIIQTTLKEFIAKGPSATELQEAKNNIIGGFPLRLDSNSAIVRNLAVISFYNLPLNYLDTFRDKVNAVTATQIREAFNRKVHADKMLTIIVGKKN